MPQNTNRGLGFPKARNNDLLVEELGGELLIFDVSSNRAHCLNGTAAAIWRDCDGTRSFAAMAQRIFPGLDPADGERLVSVGVDRLRRRRLVESSEREAPADPSKRYMVKKLALLAAAAGFAAPLVSTVLAPTSAQSASLLPIGAPCDSGVECASGLCSPGLQVCIG
jgi:hypothetical protein